jgi:GNAT superfamily N-acetyltransferase
LDDTEEIMSITFTTFPNVAWKDKINLELNAHLESHTGFHLVKCEGIYAFYETRLIGGIIFEKYNNILWVDALWIDPTFRRQGIGTQLINQTIGFAHQNSMTCLQLNTYFEEAKLFFESCHFETIGSIPNWKHGLTCYFMKKAL